MSTSGSASNGMRAMRGMLQGPITRYRYPTRYTRIRFQSTSSPSGSQTSSSVGTHVAAGLAGGALVIAAGYSWYHFSGVKSYVDSAKNANTYLKETSQTIKQNVSKAPNEILSLVRELVKPYTQLVPGGKKAADEAFGVAEELIDKHGDEVNEILTNTRDEIQQVLSGNNTLDPSTGLKIALILKERLGQLSQIAQKAGETGLSSLAKKHPQISDALGAAYERLGRLAEKGGPEAKKIVDDTTKKVEEEFSQGFSTDRLSKARELIETGLSNVQKLAERGARENWNKAIEQAAPYLDKVPELKEILNDNAGKFVSAGVAVVSDQGERAKKIFARLKDAGGDLGKNPEKLKELKDFVQQEAKQAEEDMKRTQDDLQNSQPKSKNAQHEDK